MTTQNITCNTFTPIHNNYSNSRDTLRLSVTSQCGGTTLLGLYDIETNILEDSPPFRPGLNTVEVPAKQYLAVYCKSTTHEGGGGCIAEYTVV